MAGKLWRNDAYDIRKYRPHDIGTFVDIGGNAGTISLMTCCIDPFARILMIEPFLTTLETAKIKIGMGINLGIEPHNMALGSGEPLLFAGGRHDGEFKFLTQEEFDHWKVDISAWKDLEITRTISSFTLPQLFEKLNVDTDKSYFLKVDCEGGERFIFEDPEALKIAKGSMQMSLEVHYMGFDDQDFAEFAELMSDTHVVRRTIHDPVNKFSVTHGVVDADDIGKFPRIFQKGGAYPEFSFVEKGWNEKRPSYSEVASLRELAERGGWRMYE